LPANSSFPTRNALLAILYFFQSLQATTDIVFHDLMLCAFQSISFLLKFNLLACFRLPFSSFVCFVAVCMSVCLCVIVSPYWAHLLACVLSYQATGILVDLFTHFSGQPSKFSICFHCRFSSYFECCSDVSLACSILNSLLTLTDNQALAHSPSFSCFV
jgi:hypothetical protein